MCKYQYLYQILFIEALFFKRSLWNRMLWL